MKKLLILIVGICFLLSMNCLAMQFSQSIKMGSTGYRQAGGLGVYLKDATYNNKDYL